MRTIERVELNEQAEDGLSGTVWRFYLLRENLVLDEYVVWARPSKRHAQKVVREWSRLAHNRTTRTIPGKDVPFTPEVAQRAKQAWLALATEKLTVVHDA